jgi:acyl-CoA hydrolase
MKKIIEPQPTYITRLIKSEDLNHHGTLFAGRTAEWFVEAGFLAAASLVDPKGVVCVHIHGMHFTKPVYPGQIIKFISKVVYTGKSSMISYIKVATQDSDAHFLDGFITFVYVDEHTKPIPHHVTIVPRTDEDIALHNKAKAEYLK